MLQVLSHFGNTLFHLFTLVLPFFIIGVGSGAFIQTYIKTDFLIKYLNKGLGPIINASILGAVLPGCSCSTMPVANGLKTKVNSLGTITSFIVASPLLAPQTIILTYGLLGTKFTIWRIIFALIGSISFGFMCHWLQGRNINGFEFNNKKDIENQSCHHNKNGHHHHHDTENLGFIGNFWTITKDLGKYFLIGMIIASLLSAFIPKETIPQYVGSSGFLAFFLALVIGIPLYVCEGEEIPVTLSLITLGLGQGPAMTFLLGAVGTCIPTMMMAKKIIGKKAMTFYLIFWFTFALTAGLIFQYI